MFKTTAKLFITLLLSGLLISSNALAFHKENSIADNKKTEWDGSKETKKDYENMNKQKFCALDSKTLIIKEPVIDQNTGEQTVDENGKKVFEPVAFNEFLKTNWRRFMFKNKHKLLYWVSVLIIFRPANFIKIINNRFSLIFLKMMHNNQ